jgi:ribosomal protein S18 acetylase RimI-like enzyme
LSPDGPGPVEIRPATPADAEAIAEVGVRSWREGYRGIVSEAIDPERAWNPDRLAERLEAPKPEARTIVADAGGAVVGFVLLGACRDEDAHGDVGEVWALYVDPDYWRAGVGSALVRAALGELRTAGFAEARLWTLGESGRNLSFYEALGFRRDGGMQRRESFGSPLEVRLRLDL